MRFYWLNFVALVLLASCATSKVNHFPTRPSVSYRYAVSLRRLDAQRRLRVRVELPPARPGQPAVFVLPKLTPGNYVRLNFGQYVSDFQAFDQQGRPLAVTRQDTNSWRIADAGRLHHLTYAVAATWREFLTAPGQRPPLSRSAGSSYHPDSAFVLNYSTFTGYLEGQADQPYEVRLARPAGFYGASYLTPQPLPGDTADLVRAPTYRELVDAPVLYAHPDTAGLQVGNARVLIAFYDPAHPAPQAPGLVRSLRTILEAQRTYLGGTLPVDRYVFLVYHTTATRGIVGDGLEHNHSTLCLQQSPSLAELPGFIRSIASHEFLHILTPLSLHAEQIEHYDFRNPTFSRHLWFYEGLTEYETIHVRIRQHLDSLPTFLAVLSDKARRMQRYDDYLPLTQFSQQVLTHPDQYLNIYCKGALFNLCLDIRLRELSGGQAGTQELTRQLLRRYGPHQPFPDAQFFDILTTLTHPEMRAFFRTYLEEGRPLPLAETLATVGLTYDAATGTVGLVTHPTPTQLALRRAWLGQ